MMKKIIPFLVLPLLLIACQSKSYFEVMNVNQQRFGGYQLENAVFLNETHDLVLLIADLSSESNRRSSLKDTYLIARKAEKQAKSLEPNFKFQAIKRRIKLTHSLSKANDDLLHSLDSISDENFDAVYLRQLKATLSTLVAKMNQYIKNGEDEKLVKFAQKIIDKFAPTTASLDDI